MFPNDLLEKVSDEMPALSGPKWVREDNEHLKKNNMRSVVDLGDAGYQLTAFLHSARISVSAF